MFQIIVFVDPPSVLIMQCFVDIVALLLYAIMNCGISLLSGCRMFVMMYVAVEPPLQPLHGESFTPNSAALGDGARADIHARGFWG